MFPLTFVSDLHIDYNNSAAEFLQAYKDFSGYLVIAGDFAEVRDYNSIFFRTFEQLFDTNKSIYVVFICGNHEYYGNTIEGTHLLINNWIEEKDMDRFFFLTEELELLYAENTLITGSTLWYPNTPDAYLLQDSINDFRNIKDFTPDVAFLQNEGLKNSLKIPRFLDPNEKEIWVFHHLPSFQSVDSKFRGDRLNCYYVDPGVEALILERKPALVIHGHSHHSQMYQIGDTWVVSNPKGYGKENQYNFSYFKHLFWL